MCWLGVLEWLVVLGTTCGSAGGPCRDLGGLLADERMCKGTATEARCRSFIMLPTNVSARARACLLAAVCSFGVLVWVMLTGQHPWQGLTMVEVAYKGELEQRLLASLAGVRRFMVGDVWRKSNDAFERWPHQGSPVANCYLSRETRRAS